MRRVGAAAAEALLAALLVALLAACGAPGSNSAPDDRAVGQTRAAFYGDSYTLGTGASDPALRWSSIVCTGRGWSEFNPSVNGLGFINNREFVGGGDLPSLIIADDPDIVFVTMGLNDNFSFDRAADAIREQISADLGRLRTELPESHMIVVEPFWYTDERPASVDVIIGWVRDAAAKVDADFIPGASRWIEGHPEWMAADGLHPNDAGYAEIARRMDLELTAIDLD